MIRSRRLCGAIKVARVAAALGGASRPMVDLDASGFPELAARIQRTQTLDRWAHIICGKTIYPARVMPGPDGPVICVFTLD